MPGSPSFLCLWEHINAQKMVRVEFDDKLTIEFKSGIEIDLDI